MACNATGQPDIGQGLPGVQLATTAQDGNPQGVQHAPPGTIPNYSASAGRVTGVIQLGCGLASVILGIANIPIYSCFSGVAIGIWAGVLFYIPSGILGLTSTKKESRRVVSLYEGMSILSSLAAAVAVLLASCDLACSGYGATRAIISLQLIVSILEFLTSIIAIAFCCAGRCGRPFSATDPVARLPPNNHVFMGRFGKTGSFKFWIFQENNNHQDPASGSTVCPPPGMLAHPSTTPPVPPGGPSMQYTELLPRNNAMQHPTATPHQPPTMQYPPVYATQIHSE